MGVDEDETSQKQERTRDPWGPGGAWPSCQKVRLGRQGLQTPRAWQLSKDALACCSRAGMLRGVGCHWDMVSLTAVRLLGSHQMRKGLQRPLLGSPVGLTRLRVFHEFGKSPKIS
jgi:hypothetical protein